MVRFGGLIRRLRSFSILIITGCILFYYTFQNEINQLNSYAANEYLPSINTDAASKLPNSATVTAEKDLKSAKNIDKADEIEADTYSTLMEKNRYFPLLIDSIATDFSLKDKFASFSTQFVPHYEVLNQISLPNQFKKPKLGFPEGVQSNHTHFTDGGHADKDMMARIQELYNLSWDQQYDGSMKAFERSWPLELLDTLPFLIILNDRNRIDKVLQVLAKTNFKYPPPSSAPFINIEDIAMSGLSGLISAYDLNNEPRFLDYAKDMANFVLRSFDTPNRMPIVKYPWKSKLTNRFSYRRENLGTMTNWSLQLLRLSQITENDEYFDAVARVYHMIGKSLGEYAVDYLFPQSIDPTGCLVFSDEELDSQTKMKGSVMKSINENLEFVHCLQLNKFTRSNDNSQKQIFKMDYKTQSIYSSLLKSLHLLNGHDIMALMYPKEKHIVDVDKHDDESKTDPELNIPDSKDKKDKSSDTLRALKHSKSSSDSKVSSKRIIRNALESVMDLMAYTPWTPLTDNDNLTLISSLEAYTKFIPTTNELEIKLHKPYDFVRDSCSIPAILALSSKSLVGKREFMNVSSDMIESCFKIYDYFDGKVPQKAILDPCKSETCVFDEEMKIKMILEGKYKNYESNYETSKNLQHANKDGTIKISKDEELRHVISDNIFMNDGDQTKIKLKKVTILEKDQDTLSHIGLDANDIDIEQKSWNLKDGRPLWVNEMESPSIMSPRLIESIFYMYRLSGDEKWRQMGKNHFEILMSALKTSNQGPKGMWKISDISKSSGSSTEEATISIPSYWFSQTLQYFYLLFDDVNVYSMDDYIFTSSGHPLRRMTYKEKSKETEDSEDVLL